MMYYGNIPGRMAGSKGHPLHSLDAVRVYGGECVCEEKAIRYMYIVIMSRATAYTVKNGSLL